MTPSLNPFAPNPGIPYEAIGASFTVTLGKMLDGGREVDPQASTRPYIRAANLQDSGLDLNDVNTMPFTKAESDALDLRRGDVLVVEGGAVGTCVVLQEDLPGWSFQKTVNRLRPTGESSSRYIAYVLRAYRDAGVIDIVCNKSTIPHLTAEKLRALRIPAWALPVQETIADYLDRETARINTLIEEQQRLIEMLRERRQTQIDHAVWSGLDGAPRTSTPVEAAPDVPVHWRVLRNKNLLSESTTVSADGSEELLSVSHITGITPRSEKNVTMTEAETLDGYRLVAPGDLVINTMWAWMGALGVSRVEGIVSPAYGVYRSRQGAEFHPQYFDYLYRSRPYVVEMTRFSRGIWSSRLRIYPEVFLRLSVVVPPIDEQRRIASFLGEQNSKIDTMIAETERFIELARERRSALITAAVTGQIDVREVA